jgi:hypothetical protein
MFFIERSASVLQSTSLLVVVAKRGNEMLRKMRPVNRQSTTSNALSKSLNFNFASIFENSRFLLVFAEPGVRVPQALPDLH